MTFPAASKHVRVLERAGLVRRRIQGRAHYCRLHAGPLKQVADYANGYQRYWDERFDALDTLLAEMQSTTHKPQTRSEKTRGQSR